PIANVGHQIGCTDNRHVLELDSGPRTNLASTCAAAYIRANEKTRRLFNNAVFEAVLVRGGKAAEARYCEPFDLLFSSRQFEYGDLAGKGGFELPTTPRQRRPTELSALVRQL